jgi:hypothetical protein
MSTTTEPQSEIVLLEPRNRATLEDDRAALIADVERALPTEIVSPSEYAGVADLELRVSRFIDRVKPSFDDVCLSAHRTWKSACQVRALFLEPAELLKGRARALLAAYKEREERIRREEQQRIAAEEREKEIARRKAEAKSLEKAGQKELADVVRHQPIDVPAVTLPTAVPDVAGLSYREDWTWEPVGGDTPQNRARALSLIVRPEYRLFVQFDDAGLTTFARRTKGTVKVPGIRFFSRQIPVRRS